MHTIFLREYLDSDNYLHIQEAAKRTPFFEESITRIHVDILQRMWSLYVYALMQFSFTAMIWVGEYRAFLVEEFVKNDKSMITTQCPFRLCYGVMMNKQFVVLDFKLQMNKFVFKKSWIATRPENTADEIGTTID